jgi:hypothetical protein
MIPYISHHISLFANQFEIFSLSLNLKRRFSNQIWFIDLT